jgi:hypothetical protein
MKIFIRAFVMSILYSATILAQDPEQVSLKLNQSYYVAGSRLSLQAQVLDAHTLSPTQLSVPLYIEWIDLQKGTLMARWTLELDSLARAEHSFSINEKLSSGYYQIRAYTAWSRNFEIYTQNVLVLALNENITEQSTLIDTTLHIEHQPLVANVLNRLHLHLTDTFGDALAGQVTLIDDNNQTIKSLSLDKDGRGFINFVPQINQKYQLKTDNKTYQLPAVQPEGSVVLFDNKPDKNQLKIRVESRYEGLRDSISVMALVKGRPVLLKKLMPNQTQVFTCAIDSLPSGTLYVWLIDAQKKLLTEATTFEDPTERQLFNYEHLHKPINYTNELGIAVKGIVKMTPKINYKKVQLSMFLEGMDTSKGKTNVMKIANLKPDGSFAFEDLHFKKTAKVSIRAEYKDKLLAVQVDSVEIPAIEARTLPIDWRQFVLIKAQKTIVQNKQIAIENIRKTNAERMIELEGVVVKGQKPQEKYMGLLMPTPVITVRQEAMTVLTGLEPWFAFERLREQYIRPNSTDKIIYSLDGNLVPDSFVSGISLTLIGEIEIFRGAEVMSMGGSVLVNFVSKDFNRYAKPIETSVSFIKQGFE